MRNTITVTVLVAFLGACAATDPADVADDEPVAAEASQLSMYQECQAECSSERKSCMDRCSADDQWCIDGCGGNALECSAMCHHIWGHSPGDPCWPLSNCVPVAAPDQQQEKLAQPDEQSLLVWEMCMDSCVRVADRCNEYCVPGQEIDCQVRCSGSLGRCFRGCDIWIASATSEGPEQ